jgi:membrane-associated phospholipid phosphatase
MDREYATAGPPAADGPRGARSAAHAALYSTLRFIARHVGGFWPALLTFMTLGLAIGAAVTALAARIMATTQTGFTQNVDARVVAWFAELRQPWLDRVMLEITTLGNGVVITMIIAIVSAFLWLTHHRWSVYLLLAGVLGGQVVNYLLKAAFGRPRPDMVEPIAHVSTLSFPSGHAMSAIIAYGSVAFLVGRLEPTPALRRATWASAIIIILAIGVSRMYLGVHYPSDIAAGFIAGLAWIGFVAASLAAVRYFAPRRPETATEEAGLHDVH